MKFKRSALQPRSLIRSIALELLPERVMMLDLETRGGIRDFSKIELLVGGLIEYRRVTKCQVVASKYEHWEIGGVAQLQERLIDFDGLIVGMNLFGVSG